VGNLKLKSDSQNHNAKVKIESASALAITKEDDTMGHNVLSNKCEILRPPCQGRSRGGFIVGERGGQEKGFYKGIRRCNSQLKEPAPYLIRGQNYNVKVLTGCHPKHSYKYILFLSFPRKRESIYRGCFI
jgi:hypothetical protein